jgi:hypothetical protein
MITIKPTGGLCNKLRVAFSYWEYAKIHNKQLTVIWEVSDACPGFFLDYFEPINGITFLKMTDSQELSIDYVGYCWHSDFSPYKKFIYSDLKLLPAIQAKIDEKVKIMSGNFIAIQVRRTDHTKLALKNKHFTTDEDFCKFIDKNPNGNLFIASDNKQSYNYFKERYPDRVKVEFPKDDPTKLRHTSLEDSIIDIFVCVHSTSFKGSGWSSYGHFIIQLRNKLQRDLGGSKKLVFSRIFRKLRFGL